MKYVRKSKGEPNKDRRETLNEKWNKRIDPKGPNEEKYVYQMMCKKNKNKNEDEKEQRTTRSRKEAS